MLIWTCWKEVPRIWKEKSYKELWVLALLTLSITALSTAESFSVKLPNPLDWIAAAMGPFPSFIESLFQ
ncbi:hypothetical protein E1757_01575 [Paenibacillus piri]|uniref:Uncharacterized protein n=2 Tax=Paenibacillus piri TaxID=2547395 RepID=A0A4R5KXY5_9BACL|nr:hypothetical protein E1757_01575 [Paenibacillus piri]